MKKLLKYTGITLAVILALLIFIPVLFKSKILVIAKKELNASVNAKADFTDLSVSFFKHFPTITATLDSFYIANKEPFVGDTLISASQAEISLNLFSLFGSKPLEVRGVFLENPRVHALVNKDGFANWDIAVPDTGSTASTDTTGFKMSLAKYAVHNAYVVYEDQQAGMQAKITGLDHQGSGDFDSDLFTLKTSTQAGAASFTYDNIPYLNQTKTVIDADLSIDARNSKYSFSNALLKLNDLELHADGYLSMPNDSAYGMDIKFAAPSTDFKQILSLIPSIYQSNFEKIKTEGQAACKGTVKGVYSPVSLPAFDVDLEVRNGMFQYPDLPDAVKNIQLDLKCSNPDGVPDHTIIDLSKGHVEFGKDPLDFRFRLTQPETLRNIDAALKGKLNLAQVSKFISLEKGTSLAGLVSADAYAKGSIGNADVIPANFQAGGFMDLSNLAYTSPSVPAKVSEGNIHVNITNTGADADQTLIDVTKAHLKLNQNPLDFTLKLSQPVTAMNFSGTANGSLDLDHIKQFVTLEEETSVTGKLAANVSFKGNKKAIDSKDPNGLLLNGNSSLSNLVYKSKDYKDGIMIPNAVLAFSNEKLALTNTTVSVLGSRISAAGTLINFIPYYLDKGKLAGSLDLNIDQVLADRWLSSSSSASTDSSATTAFKVPENLDLKMSAKAGRVVYDKVTYNNMRGTLTVKEQTVTLSDFYTDALGGNMAFAGSYATPSHVKDPIIHMQYKVAGLDLAQTFKAYNTVSKLMPIGNFLAGKLTSEFRMDGSLNDSLYPVLTTLSGNGNLLLLEGVLSKFAPLEQLANQLNVQALKGLALKDIKSQFAFNNGQVLVKPFTVKTGDINMEIGGVHGLDQSLDYVINLDLPRSYFGSAGNNLINGLAAKASAKGIPVNISDRVQLAVKMKGTLTKPQFQTDLKQAAGNLTQQMKEQATEFLKQKADSAKQSLKDTFKVVKQQVIEDAKNELARTLLGKQPGDTTTTQPTLKESGEKAKETIKNTFGKFLKKP